MTHADDHQGTRRDFLYYATAGAGVVVTGAAVWPLVNQMNPSADVLALASIRVDVSAVDPGTQLTVLWQGKPVFIRARTEEEIAASRAVALDDLVDQNAENANLGGRRPCNRRKPRVVRRRCLACPDGCLHAPWLCPAGRTG